ncbi:DUF2325 domain-containing protein [Effusibacillus pohliae]|uniref:DUF2325 domain-containing protein n=1 Tax=Effusibacillus pohliae TaxID=232270 RepID=UPI0003692A5E|nr:DUF2325 domain-containing protein [Effusibacillus pohliae]
MQLLDKWRSWFLHHIGPRVLPAVCAAHRICPPGFRTPEKVPYPLLKSYFDRRLQQDYTNPKMLIRMLRTEYPGLEEQIASLPAGCTADDAKRLNDEMENVHLVLALLLSDRQDLSDLAVRMMEQSAPFELPAEPEAPANPPDALQKENQRLAKLLDESKKAFLKQEDKWRKEFAKLRRERDSAKQELMRERKSAEAQAAAWKKQLQEAEALRQQLEREVQLLDGNLQRTREQLRKLNFENLQLLELNRSQEAAIQQLTEEVARLTALLAAPSAVKENGRAEAPLYEAPPHSDLDPVAAPPETAESVTAPIVAAESGILNTNPELPVHPPAQPDYPAIVRGILRIPVRSRFGFLSTEQGIDLFVSEKIIHAIGAQDGDELEGHLLGEYAPGLPQYHYRILQKSVEPSVHRELLGIVEDRAGWIGVRDLHDPDIFVPLHAYELPNVEIGDVVTLLFDATHPHNNRILTIHDHEQLTEEEAAGGRSARRRPAKTGDSPPDIEQSLRGKHILICGAQSNMVAQYEQAIQQRGGSVVVLESQPASIEPYVSKADVIICNTHQISHPFYWVVKSEASKQGKPLRYPISGGVSSILREVEACK